MIGKIVLDYTDYAPPLTADIIKLDLDEYVGTNYRRVSKVVMWVHQWDYIKKLFSQWVRPKYVLEDVEMTIDGFTVAAKPIEHGGMLWGVPVEVRES